MQVRGYLYIIAAASLWGVLGPFSRLAFSEGLSPLEVAFWRALLAWGFFGLHSLFTKSYRIRTSDLPLVSLFAVTGITLFYASYQMAVRQGGAALAAVLLYTAPAWVVLIARVAFREALTREKILALILTLVGVGAVAWDSEGAQISISALLMGLTAGFCYSLYYIFGKHFSTRYSSSNLFLYLLPIGAATLWPWVDFTNKTLIAWAALFFIATFCTYGAYVFYYLGVKYLEASRAAITATLEPVVAAVIAFVWWGEAFGIGGYSGTALIIIAVLLMVWKKPLPKAPE